MPLLTAFVVAGLYLYGVNWYARRVSDGLEPKIARVALRLGITAVLVGLVFGDHIAARAYIWSQCIVPRGQSEPIKVAGYLHGEPRNYCGFDCISGFLINGGYSYIEFEMVPLEPSSDEARPRFHHFYIAPKGDPNCRKYIAGPGGGYNNRIKRLLKRNCIASEQSHEPISRYRYRTEQDRANNAFQAVLYDEIVDDLEIGRAVGFRRIVSASVPGYVWPLFKNISCTTVGSETRNFRGKVLIPDRTVKFN